jgi:aryl-alcohol dehydrogenase-like predicted oxidoreductase
VCEWTKVAEQYSLPRIASIQNVYNLLSREFDAGVAEACHREDVGLLVYSALAFGHLTGKYLRGGKPSDARLIKFGPLWPRYARPQIEPAVLRYEALAKDAGLTLTQLALAFCYRSPYVASTILGATSVEQLREQIDAWSVQLSDDLVKAIDAIHEQMTNPAR